MSQFIIFRGMRLFTLTLLEVLAFLLLLSACGVPVTRSTPQGGPAQPTVTELDATQPFPGIAPGAAATTTPGEVIHSGKGTPEGEPAAIVAGGIELDEDSLVKLLRRTGAAVEETGQVQQPFFTVTGTLYRVNGAEVQVFEFEDAAARQAASDQIPADGSAFPGMVVDWIAPPHFWASGRVIVLYVGEDEAIIGLLDGLLGQQITS